MESLRRFLLIWLAAVMVLTSGSMSLSRTAPDGQVIVICTGTEIATIQVDLNGDEIQPLPVCPDCLIAKAMLANPQPTRLVFQTTTAFYRIILQPSVLTSARLTADARGPPLSI